MKIAEVVAVFPPYPGGTGFVCYNNARQLTRMGHEVTVFTIDYKYLGYEDDPADLKIVRLRSPLLYGGGALLPQLYKHLRDFDVIHLHYPFFGGAEFVYLASLLRGQKYFLTYHMDVQKDSLPRKLMIGCYETVLLKKIIGGASRIGALSAEHLRSSKVGRLIDWSKVIEIPNGVDLEKFVPREPDRVLVKKYGLEGKVVILFVGHLIPLKGLHILIDALSMMDNERIVLIVVGEGKYKEKYELQAKNKGLEDKVIFVGSQSQNEDLPKYYGLCDFLVLPSSIEESFGMVVLEAMASGKPAIVSSLPGPSGLIEDGKDGLIAKAGDSEDLKNKIEFLVKEKDIREEMGKLARKKVLERYGWDLVGKQLEHALEVSLKN
jgi:glycosyltransferase involved in cell wall biosynthesis